MMDNEQHHWVGCKPDPGGQWGFIYCITHLPSGKKYIGKKQYRKSSGKAKRRCMSVNLPAFKEWHWNENDWRWYSGSSKYLKEFKKGTNKNDWEHEILVQADNSMDLHYLEIEYLIWNRVLTLVDEEGEYVFFNRAVPGIKFRPPGVITEETRRKMSVAKKGVPKTEATRRKLSEAGTGKVHSEAAKAKMSAAKKKDTPCVNCGAQEWGVRKQAEKSNGKTGNPKRYCLPCDREAGRKYRAKKKLEAQNGK